MQLFIDNDQYIDLIGLKDIAVGFVAGATVTMRMQYNGVDVSGATWPIILTQVAGSGHYRGVLPSTLILQRGATYKLLITAQDVNTGAIANWQIDEVAIYRTA